MTNSAPMNSSLRKRLDDLKHKKLQAQKSNHAEAHRARLTARDDAVEGDLDKMNWSALQWEAYLRNEKPLSSGYKNQSQLAHATYLKEMAKMTPDLEKYQKYSARDAPETDFVPTSEDAEKIAQGLREASDRKQTRRRGGDGGQYITEKNRQFNMKLDREFGSSPADRI